MNDLASRMRLIIYLAFDRQLDACYHFQISSITQLKKYFVGDNLPSAAVLMAIANYGFDIGWLLTGNGGLFMQSPQGEALHGVVQVRIAAGQVPQEYVDQYRELVSGSSRISRGDNGETGSVESVGVGGIGLIEGKPAEASSKKPVKAVKPARS